MAHYYRQVMDTFWSPYVWLPPNTTWADIAPESSTEIQHADYRHLFYPLPMALIMFLLRYLFEKYWFAPVGISLGIKNSRPKNAPSNLVLETAYAQSKKWKHKQIQGLAKQLDMTERQVERWLRLRKGQNKPSTLTKFCENAWRCTYYTFSFSYGVCVLWDKPWLWDINECWNGFPHQTVTTEIWWYYMFSMAFYWSLCVSQFFDVKRKDFWQMFIHHIATILLMCFSWVVNVWRAGTLVLVVHDSADMFLEAAKMAKYAGYQRVCDVFFAILTVLWIITRLGLFPFWIIRKNGFPHQTVTTEIWWYYMFSMAFYWSLCVSQFFDVKRKDFWQMFIHHIATILLMCFSWVVNVWRVGTLVLVVHDSADMFLEAAKMAKYAGYQRVCDVFFAILTVLWIITRLGLFPFWIIRNTSIDAPKMVPMFPAYYIFNGLLCLLLVLHIFWTYLILKIAHNSLNAGQMEGDIRSSSDDFSEDSNNSNSANTNHTKAE